MDKHYSNVRIIGRLEHPSYLVSTIYVNNVFETGVKHEIYGHKLTTVQRYDNVIDAGKGHEAWCKMAMGNILPMLTNHRTEFNISLMAVIRLLSKCVSSATPLRTSKINKDGHMILTISDGKYVGSAAYDCEKSILYHVTKGWSQLIGSGIKKPDIKGIEQSGVAY